MSATAPGNGGRVWLALVRVALDAAASPRSAFAVLGLLLRGEENHHALARAYSGRSGSAELDAKRLRGLTLGWIRRFDR